jgi:hypothetical protein
VHNLRVKNGGVAWWTLHPPYRQRTRVRILPRENLTISEVCNLHTEHFYVLKKSNICPKILFLLSDNFSAEIWVHKIDPWTASHTTMAMTSQILVHLWPARRLASTTHCDLGPMLRFWAIRFFSNANFMIIKRCHFRRNDNFFSEKTKKPL